jgi:hypothetical protein
MDTLWGIIVAVTLYGGLPIVGGLWWFESRRSLTRNRSGRCAMCGKAWSETEAENPFLVHGRLVCEPCGERARRRLPWHFGTLVAAAAFATGMIVASAEGSLSAMILFPAASTVAMSLGAIQWMKAANRKAQRRIATGEFPDLAALQGGPMEPDSETDVLPEPDADPDPEP